MRTFRLAMLIALMSVGLIFGARSARGAAGSLDPTFGKGGVTLTSGFSAIVSTNAVLQSDGKILILLVDDQTTQFTSELVRYLSTGGLDTSFGNRGFVQVPTGGSVALQSDGKILVAGPAPNGNGSEFAIVRLNPNGSLDTSFGSRGEATAQLAQPNVGQALLVQPDGKILFGVTLEEIGRGHSFRIGLARFSANGSLDQTFGSGGTVIADSIHGVTNLAVLSDGEILVLNGGLIAQFTAEGGLESTVTSGTIVAKSANIFQSDSKYVIAQPVYVGAPRGRDLDVQAVRYTATGAVDSSFNTPIFDFSGEGGSSHFDVPQGSALQANNQFVLVGDHSVFSSPTLNALARLNPNGSFDSTFGNAGIVTNDVPAGTDGLHRVLIQTDGKILAIGTAKNGAEIFIERYLP